MYSTTLAGTGLWDVTYDEEHVGSIAQKFDHYTAYDADGNVIAQCDSLDSARHEVAEADQQAAADGILEAFGI